jgi:hypothetical protein
MSSPRRAAKPVAKSALKSAVKRTAKMPAKTAGKALRGSVVAQPSPPSGAQVVESASADAKRLAAELERGIAEGRLDMVNAEALQKLIAAACRVYTARVETGEQLMPVPRNSITATDVMVTASGLLRAADLAVFELGMWQSWTGR